MFAERNIHEYKKQILSMNKVEELDDSKDGQKDEYEWKNQPTLKDYEKTKT